MTDNKNKKIKQQVEIFTRNVKSLKERPSIEEITNGKIKIQVNVEEDKKEE